MKPSDECLISVGTTFAISPAVEDDDILYSVTTVVFFQATRLGENTRRVSQEHLTYLNGDMYPHDHHQKTPYESVHGKHRKQQRTRGNGSDTVRTDSSMTDSVKRHTDGLH